MINLVAGIILVVLVDQVFKFLMVRCSDGEAISLGWLGSMKSAPTQIWLARLPSRVRPTTIWIIWSIAAGALAIGHALFSLSWEFCALLLGGSLSHALETSIHGSICDYVCLRFWPRFNLADVAIAVGAIGLALELAIALTPAR